MNAADETGWTALMIAAVTVQPQSVSALLDAGARVDQRDHHGDTALIGAAAVRFNNLLISAEVVGTLLAHGASVDRLARPIGFSVSRGPSVVAVGASIGQAPFLKHRDRRPRPHGDGGSYPCARRNWQVQRHCRSVRIQRTYRPLDNKYSAETTTMLIVFGGFRDNLSAWSEDLCVASTELKALIRLFMPELRKSGLEEFSTTGWVHFERTALSKNPTS